jgi:ribosomal protein L7/L12
MQAFERILMMLRTGDKTNAINEYAETMGITKEEARKAIENLQKYSKRVQPTVARRLPPC